MAVRQARFPFKAASRRGYGVRVPPRRARDLPAFMLSNLRHRSDLVQELTGGDILAQQTVLNHRRVQTTHDHYTSDAARQ